MYNLQIIKDILAERGMQVVDLAKQVGITPQHLHKICKDNSTKASTVDKIAKALRVPVATFLDNDDEAQVTDSHKAVASGPNAKATTNDYRGASINHSQCCEESQIIALREKINHLTEKIQILQKMLEDKERTIEILLRSQSS